MPVKKLSRVAIGPLRLKALALAQWRELTRDEVISLRKAAAGKPAPVARVRRRGGQVRSQMSRNRRGPSADNQREGRNSRNPRSSRNPRARRRA